MIFSILYSFLSSLRALRLNSSTLPQCLFTAATSAWGFKVCSQAMLSFYQGPALVTDKILNELNESGANALFLYDPYDEDFNETVIMKVMKMRNAVGMFIPKVVADSKRLDKQVSKYLEKFIQVAKMAPRVVRIEKEVIPQEIKKILKKNKLLLFQPCVSLSSEPDFTRFEQIVNDLDYKKGRISFCVPEDACCSKIAKILSHIRSRNFNIIHPETYLKKDLTPVLSGDAELLQKYPAMKYDDKDSGFSSTERQSFKIKAENDNEEDNEDKNKSKNSNKNTPNVKTEENGKVNKNCAYSRISVSLIAVLSLASYACLLSN